MGFGSNNYSSNPQGSICIKYSQNVEYTITVPTGVKIASIRISAYSNSKSSAASYLEELMVGTTSITINENDTYPCKPTDKVISTHTYKLSTVANGDDETNNTIKFKFSGGETVAALYLISESSSKSYTLDFDSYQWKSLCLDFDATIPVGVEAYTGKLNDDETVVVTTNIIKDDSEDKVLPANTPVVVKNVGTATSYTLEQGTTTKTSSDYTDNDLKGVTEQTDLTTLAQDGKTVLTFGVDANTVYGFRLPANTYIGANRVYLYVTSTQVVSNKVIGLSSDGNTSSIDAINVNTSTADAPAYNMMGQRVGANAKGLIIKGGRKYIVK